jgi:hypothetical protein
MDGNSSLKLVDSSYQTGTTRKDDRTLSSLRWLEVDEVDHFQNDMKGSHKGKVCRQLGISLGPYLLIYYKQGAQSGDPCGDSVNEIAWLNVNEIESLKECADSCVDRWKAAAPDARKKKFDLFAVAGVFISVCRHGHMLFICDMVRSGEL